MDALMIVVQVAVFAQMLAIGMTHSPQVLLRLTRDPGQLLRGLLAVIVIFPVAVGVLIAAFDLPVAMATGLALLAAAPGAPLTTKRARQAGGDEEYAASLQLTLAVLAVVVAPLTLALFYALFEIGIEEVTVGAVARQVALVTFLPVVIGLLAQRFRPQWAERLRRPITRAADILFLVMALLVVVAIATQPKLREMLRIGPSSIFAIAVMVCAGLAAGYVLGGPERARRASLSTACIARNLGLALTVLGLSEAGHASIPAVLVYAIVGVVLAIPYGIFIRRGAAQEAAAGRTDSLPADDSAGE